MNLMSFITWVTNHGYGIFLLSDETVYESMDNMPTE